MTTTAEESTDFRHEKMPSREGLRLAWDRYVSAVDRLVKSGKVPGLKEVDRRTNIELVLSRGGFWLVWHLNGGFEGMRNLGLSEASIYRKIKAFRETFGEHPDEFKMPGVTIDVEEYLRYWADTSGDGPPVVKKRE